MKSTLLVLVLTLGIGANDRDFWQGYASSIFSHQMTKGRDVIHEGPVRPSKQEPLPPTQETEKPAPTPEKPADEPKLPPAPQPLEKPETKPEVKPELAPPAKPANEIPLPFPVPEGDPIPPPAKVAAPKPLPTTYVDAMAYGRDNGCKVLVVFSTKTYPNCGPFVKNVIDNEQVRATLRANNIKIIYRTYCEEDEDAANFLKIDTVPYYFITDGKVKIKSGIGYRPVEDFIEWIKDASKENTKQTQEPKFRR